MARCSIPCPRRKRTRNLKTDLSAAILVLLLGIFQQVVHYGLGYSRFPCNRFSLAEAERRRIAAQRLENCVVTCQIRTGCARDFPRGKRDSCHFRVITAADRQRSTLVGRVDELEYVSDDNDRQRPIMIHRALYGSMERFVAVVIEHFAGAFPVWLSPVQVMVIPVADGHNEYADKVADYLKEQGIRAEADKGKGRMNKKIREHRGQRIPYMLIVGDRDIENGTVSIRLRSDEDLGAMPLEDFGTMIKDNIANRSLELK